MKTDHMELERPLENYLHDVWPKPYVERLKDDDPDCVRIKEIAKNQGLKVENLALTVVASYVLCDFEHVEGKSVAVFETDPMCNTDNPRNWWWSTQHYSEPVKDLLRNATDTHEKIRVEIPEVELVIVPDPFRIKKEWRFVKK